MDDTAPHPNTGDLVATVAAFIDEHALIAPQDSIVVGVSGGADSVALLAILRALAAQAKRAYNLTAAHLHHGLRESADVDQAFVEDLASRWNVPLVSTRCDVSAARASGESTEAAARRLRYDFLRDAAQRAGAACVAVGHHADDNAETVLHRIVRGTHLRGLAGIPAARVLGRGGPRLVRPLLGVRRSALEAYCRAAGLTWRTDPTNADTRFRRNFIRHELLPLLRAHLNPKVDESLLRLAGIAAEADADLHARARQLLRKAQREAPAGALALDRKTLAAESRWVQTCAVRIALEQMGLPMGHLDAKALADLANLLDATGPAAAALPGGYVARRCGAELLVLGPDRPDGAAQIEPTELDCPGRTVLADGRTLTCTVRPVDRAAFKRHCRNHSPGIELLDANQLCGRLICRSRREGDSFVPLGAPGRQTVSNFLTNLKVPSERRAQVLCIRDGKGIAYVAPYRIDHRVRVTDGTQKVLRIELIE